MSRYNGPRLGDTAFNGARKQCYCCKYNYITNSAARNLEKQLWEDEAWDELLDMRG